MTKPDIRPTSFMGRAPRAVLSRLALLLCIASACTAPLPPGDTAPEPTTSVSFTVAADSASSESQTPGALRLQPFGSTFADVARIRIDVEDAASHSALFSNFDLVPSPSGWSGTLPSLPRHRALTFIARAFSGSDALLFQGSTTQTLVADRETVALTLAPPDGAPITLPRIPRIQLPGEFVFGQPATLTFFVEATSGEALTFTLTAAPDGGTFLPASGTFTLTGTSGAFVSRYLPPFGLPSPTDYTHSLTVTNPAGHSVSATFVTRVLPADRSTDSLGTTVRVLFNPVIKGLSASRLAGTSDVAWTASVSDDQPAQTLGYAWSFAPDAPITPAPGFTTQANPTVLQHYATSLQGRLTLQVTDAAGGRTTATYRLGAQQFPDAPVRTGGPTDVAQLHAGDSHTCALLNDGSVRCFGSGAQGRLGYTSTTHVGDDETPASVGPVPLAPGEKAVQLATGLGHTCALLSTGLVRCWGANAFGQLGLGHVRGIGDDEPITHVGTVNLGGARALRITAGDQHTCALLTSGRVRCWGANARGQLGYGNLLDLGDDEAPPTDDVPVGAPVQDLVAGGNHTCALLFSGRIRCWGANSFGQLGYSRDDDVGDTELPSTAGDVDVGGITVQLALGGNHTCALLESGAVRCWGANSTGQVGSGNPDYATPRTQVELGYGLRAVQVATGAQHTCALLESGQLKCWGNGARGRLGYGNVRSLSAPIAASIDVGGAPAVFLTAGGQHTCAVLSNGRALCWGFNSTGQLGQGHVRAIGDDEAPALAGSILLVSP
ncbi:RCC1 domain-containing protein [Corallococcus terminator]|uniref:RTX toxin n=1 Tax=Corallococcus terminator TaxID=2316733 RepID=A0A3A8IKG2_9BACT|nr:RTX toxin [Corallococcus terminator]RKG83685.1 RTX toxin [Corallococcus terminator]